MNSRMIIKELEADGWQLIGVRGSHHYYKHTTKTGKVTVPHPKKDLPPKTIQSIRRQAQL
ncbi:MAG: type II toxin-antitoxin system HicA family toxin [Bacterioplanes sp.]|nr:type II toxin-antitoxin system HicA family toxin [Bacterioplanes sp.]